MESCVIVTLFEFRLIITWCNNNSHLKLNIRTTELVDEMLSLLFLSDTHFISVILLKMRLKFCVMTKILCNSDLDL